MLPEVDVDSNEQNAWVQDWLTTYFKKFSSVNSPKEEECHQVVVEAIQETYGVGWPD